MKEKLSREKVTLALKKLITGKCAAESFDLWYRSIAEEILLRWQLQTSTASYRIREIEFYYYDEKEHRDTTVYGYMPPSFKKDNKRVHILKLRQCETFAWFVHYSGIDIVFGKKESPGGILIRSIERVDKNTPLAPVFNRRLVTGTN